MRIADLPRLPPNTDVYLIGTGPSLRCLDLSYFDDKVCIGLNQAWRHLKTAYSITVHPELVVEYEQSDRQTGTQWVVKKKPPMASLSLDDPRYYVFTTSYDVLDVVRRPADVLFLGEGVQTTAMDLAARMGARSVVLVGCDAKSLGGDFHAHDQHVRWLGQRPADQYALYREDTARVRAFLRRLGVPVMTLSPFIGVDAGEEDYLRLRDELGLEKLPAPKDVSPYRRNLKQFYKTRAALIRRSQLRPPQKRKGG